MTHFCLHSPKKNVCHGPFALALAAGAAFWACHDQLLTPPAFATGWTPPQKAGMQRPVRSAFGSEHDFKVAAAFQGMHDRHAGDYWWRMVTVVGTVAAAAQLVQRGVASKAGADAKKSMVMPVSTVGAPTCGPCVFSKGLMGVDVPFHAVHGSANAGTCTRGAKVVVKGDLNEHILKDSKGKVIIRPTFQNGRGKHGNDRGPYRIERNAELFQRVTRNMPGLPGEWGRGMKHPDFRKSREKAMSELKYQYKFRRLKKRKFRQLWIQRVNANCRLHGVRYSQFIASLYRKNIVINRKILSQLGVYDRSIFTNVMDVAIPSWKIQMKQKWDPEPPKKDLARDEDIILTHLERKFPDLYTNPCIRFNRRMTPDSIEYTVDVGDPEEWRKVLPKSPELANFNLPDHFIKDANKQFETGKILQAWDLRNQDDEDEEYLKKQKALEKTLAKEQAMAEAGEPVPPKKEGLSRDDWFNDEPQSWY